MKIKMYIDKNKNSNENVVKKMRLTHWLPNWIMSWEKKDDGEHREE